LPCSRREKNLDSAFRQSAEKIFYNGRVPRFIEANQYSFLGAVLPNERVERRLAAVLAADVAGYRRLMGADEEGTLALLKAFRKTIVDPSIAAHRGRIVKTNGDDMLAEFASAVEAVRCAADVQRGMADQNADVPQDKRVEFRIGIHVGDIIFDDNDIFGDGRPTSVFGRPHGALVESLLLRLKQTLKPDKRAAPNVAQSAPIPDGLAADPGFLRRGNVSRLLRSSAKRRCTASGFLNPATAF
jgi:hypothetical protein